MARKFGLGRGLSALIPEEDFPDVKQDEAVETGIDVRSDLDIDIDLGADLGTGVEPQPSPSEGVEPEVRGSPLEPQPSPLSDEDSLLGPPVEQSGTEVPAEVPEEVSAEVPEEVPADLPVSDAVTDSIEDDSLELNGLELGDLPVSDVPAVEFDDTPIDDLSAGDLDANNLELDSLEVGDLPVSDVALKDLWSNGVAANDVTAPEVSDSVEQGAVLENNFVVQLALDRLVPNPGQPRKNFDEIELQELADSIKEHGVIMPVIAADTGDGNYIIIAGERRTRAARLAGLQEVPVIIRNYTDEKRLEISLIENIQRSDLNPIEEATAYKNLMDYSGLSHEELAARVGKNRSTVTNALRLLKLPAEVQKSLETGGLSAGHARALLSVMDDKLRDKLFKEITAKGLSVRETEKKASALNTAGEAAEAEGGASGVEKEKAKRPPEITDMEEKFIEKLGTKVSISGGLEKGLIKIEYYSMEDLDRLYGLLGP